MSDRAKEFLKSKGISDVIYDMNNIKSPQLSLENLLKSYADQEVEREKMEWLDKDYGLEITKACRMRPMLQDEDKSQCFRLGAAFILNHLKQSLKD